MSQIAVRLITFFFLDLDYKFKKNPKNQEQNDVFFFTHTAFQMRKQFRVCSRVFLRAVS